MKKRRLLQAFVLLVCLFHGFSMASSLIPANDPNIQYFGRWDFSDPLAPAHSWPGVYIYAEFEGTSIGVRMNDNYSYYNVIIDDTVASVFHGTVSGAASYTIATGLPDGHHTVLITKRNETTWTRFSFSGFIVDDGKSLVGPAVRLARKVEFLGDSFTSASGNEWIDNTVPSDVTPYTNVYEGFGPIVARHYGAQYATTSRSGYGLVLDWQGSYAGNIPDDFNRALCFSTLPLWDFEQWIPDLVVICLGLNDYAGFGGWSGPVAADKTELFKARYHEFIATVRDVYPGVKILAVAADVEWIRTSVSAVVQEERSQGNRDIFYTTFPTYPGGYVNNGHPNVATHHKIADVLIATIDTINAWVPYQDTLAPRFVKLPESPVTVYDTTFSLTLRTDTYATVRYSMQDRRYNEMEYEFTVTGKRDHTVLLRGNHNGHYTYFVRAVDVYGNMMDTSAVIECLVDTSKAFRDWNDFAYDDSQWKTGSTPLGSAASGGNTTVMSKVTTAYLRKPVTIDSLGGIAGFGLLIKGNDGAIVYVNGDEVQRINMLPDADPAYGTLAMGPGTMSSVVVLNATNGLLNKFRVGENMIAVEVHASSAAGDISFDSQLFDSKNRVYYRLGSSWTYSDAGSMPPDQIHDKVTGIMAAGNGPGPDRFVLEQNFPNPFNPRTVISSQLPVASHVGLVVYDLLGREVAVLVDELRAEGSYRDTFDARALASGVYICRLTAGLPDRSGPPDRDSRSERPEQAGSVVQTRAMLLLK